MNKIVEIKGSSGKLAAIKQKPNLKPEERCPMVILMHGLMRTKESPILTLLADKLQKIGIASIRFDFDGCGQSEGEFQNMTVLKEIVDAQCVYDYVSQLHYVSCIALVGHSQGGVVAGMLAGELGKEKIKSLVMMAPAAVLKQQAIEGNTLNVHFDPKHIPDFIEVNGRKIGKQYLKTAQTLPIFETTSRYKGSVCIIQGDNDKIEPPLVTAEYKKIFKTCQYHLLKNEDHAFAVDPEMPTQIVADFLKLHLH